EKGGGDVNPSFSQWDLFVVVKRWSRGGGGGHGNSRNPGHHISTLSFFSRFTARAFSALVCPSVISPLSTHTHTHTHRYAHFFFSYPSMNGPCLRSPLQQSVRKVSY